MPMVISEKGVLSTVAWLVTFIPAVSVVFKAYSKISKPHTLPFRYLRAAGVLADFNLYYLGLVGVGLGLHELIGIDRFWVAMMGALDT
jgi:hypothetical protein